MLEVRVDGALGDAELLRDITVGRTSPTASEPPQYNWSANIPPKSHAKLRGVWLYLAILATVYVVASLVLGVISCAAMQSNARKIEQLQIYMNDNLCNQQAYQGGTTCQGGDANGGSTLP